MTALTSASLTARAMSYRDHPRRDFIRHCKSFSMLHEETLLILNQMARNSRTVLEIGPYIGGSTVAIGDGLKACDDPLHLIAEIGGAYAHRDLPSTDILRDLKQRISDYELRGTRVFEGWSNSPHVVDAIKDALGERKIDLLFIDADGNIKRDVDIYRPHLSDDCVIVLDDFLVQEDNAKQLEVRQWVAEATDSGMVRYLGVVLWGTWVGQLSAPGAR